MKRHFRLAHLSDVHLSPLAGARWRALANKRLVGYINWTRNRHKVHRRDKLDMLLHDIGLHAPDHIAVTGDLVNLGLPEEFIAAMNWLQDLGTPDYVSVVPGNHDAYVKLRNDPGFERWRPYMVSNEGGRAYAGEGAGFPYMKRYGDVALIGLSSAVPTMPFIASGKLGAAQIKCADQILEKTAGDGLCRVVLIHHPPLNGRSNWYHGLSDAKAFGNALASRGAELVLHGHWHSQSTNSIPGPRGEYSRYGCAVSVIGQGWP